MKIMGLVYLSFAVFSFYLFCAWHPLSIAQPTLATEKQVDVIAIEPYPKSLAGERITVDVREVARNLHDCEKVSEATFVLGQSSNAYLSSGTVNLLKMALDGASIESYNDESIEVRMNATKLLGLSRNPEATPIITDLLHNDPAWRVRDLAATFLPALAGEAAIPELLHAWAVDQAKHRPAMYGIGDGVIFGLGSAGGKAVPILIRLLNRSTESSGGNGNADLIIESLERTCDRRAIEPLIDIISRPTSLSHPSMKDVQKTAARTLASFSVKFTYGIQLNNRGRRRTEGVPLLPQPNRLVRESDRTRIRQALVAAGYNVEELLQLDPDDFEYYPDGLEYYFDRLE